MPAVSSDRMGEEAPPATTLYVDGCPGCAIERKKAANKGIPYKEFFFVAVTTVASGIGSTTQEYNVIIPNNYVDGNRTWPTGFQPHGQREHIIYI